MAKFKVLRRYFTGNCEKQISQDNLSLSCHLNSWLAEYKPVMLTTSICDPKGWTHKSMDMALAAEIVVNDSFVLYLYYNKWFTCRSYSQTSFLQLFINNEFVDSASGKTFPTLNPTNEKKIADIAEADKVIFLWISNMLCLIFIVITYTEYKNNNKHDHYICVPLWITYSKKTTSLHNLVSLWFIL